MSLSGELIRFPLDVCALREGEGRVDPGTHAYMTPTLWQAREDKDHILEFTHQQGTTTIYMYTNNQTILFF